jgi:hypothetical protein
MKKLALILVFISATPAVAFDRMEQMYEQDRFEDQNRAQMYEMQRQNERMEDQMEYRNRTNPFFNQGY